MTIDTTKIRKAWANDADGVVNKAVTQLCDEIDRLRPWQESPPIEWRGADGPGLSDRLVANVDGCVLECTYLDEGNSAFKLTAADGRVMADIVVKPMLGQDITDSVCEIGAALYWSHRRGMLLKAESERAA